MKNSYTKYVFICFILFHLGTECFAQQIEEKYEREEKIKKEHFPLNAIKLAEPLLQQAKKTKFYKEYNQNSHAFEIKTELKKQKISIKFNAKGALEDIEVLRDFKQLPTEAQQQIEKYFATHYQKHLLKRIQIQYSPKEESIFTLNDFSDYLKYSSESSIVKIEHFILRYEIEAEVLNQEKKRAFYEFLFDSTFEIQKIRKIVARADDNILY